MTSKSNLRICIGLLSIGLIGIGAGMVSAQTSINPSNVRFSKVAYNHPGLVVDLGVGLWAQPLPIDIAGTGHYDLAVATADVPANGIYLFKNRPGADPVFESGKRIGSAVHNITVSYVEGNAVVMTPASTHPEFVLKGLQDPVSIPLTADHDHGRIRARQWKMVDYEGDGDHDILIGLGVWGDYGWDDAYDTEGNWTNGPLHGYVYLSRNEGTDDAPQFHPPVQLQCDSGPVDVYGAPSPNLADWDRDGDLDLMCGSFMDTITYFENTGTRSEAKYAAGRELQLADAPLRMDLQMLQVTAVDWDGDGDTDLVVGQEDGRVALAECTGRMVDGVPAFEAPRFFQQEAEYVKVGALATPYSVDWDGDGDEDLIVGDTAGYISFVENLGGGEKPKWAKPVYLEAGGETIRIQAGPNGSIQGPAEAKWGYTVPCVADWNHDGRLDIVINSIWGEVLWYENVGGRGPAKLREAQRVQVAWEGTPPKPEWNWWDPKDKQLVTQWRTSPMVHDINGDGWNDLVMLDHEGYLSFFERTRKNDEVVLLPGKRIFMGADGKPLRLNEKRAGKSGRRKLALVDWDGDGRLDLMANSKNIEFWKNIAEKPDEFIFENQGNVNDQKLAGHTTSPSIIDWNRDGIPDLLVGAEDGFFYHALNPRSTNASQGVIR